MFNRNLDNTINEKRLPCFGRFTTRENIFTAGAFTTGFMRTKGGNFYCYFKGRLGAVCRKASCENCFYCAGSMYDPAVKIAVLITTRPYAKPTVKTIFTTCFWPTTSHTYKPAERNFTTALKADVVSGLLSRW